METGVCAIGRDIGLDIGLDTGLGTEGGAGMRAEFGDAEESEPGREDGVAVVGKGIRTATDEADAGGATEGGRADTEGVSGGAGRGAIAMRDPAAASLGADAAPVAVSPGTPISLAAVLALLCVAAGEEPVEAINASRASSSSEAYIPSSVARKLWPAVLAASAARRTQTIASCRSPRAQSDFAVEMPQTTSSASSGLGSGSLTTGSAIGRSLSLVRYSSCPQGAGHKDQ